ncbi:uncharacterized protein MCYG_03436 [Microsporum canis CBS 113480]|uniref:Uncharacterized protein n=1 Tax=Arthroderma otae (strain ATCC MYA-4605 / CBS 113480) TaxID=554155 RepID=C5FLP5_ARTOC|nr:uncharacterized protein MCYG_03436 [Microsporum canis CBS 113480]EEQ30617.1 predicted protein [Microsporum canis CBS 113480]
MTSLFRHPSPSYRVVHTDRQEEAKGVDINISIKQVNQKHNSIHGSIAEEKKKEKKRQLFSLLPWSCRTGLDRMVRLTCRYLYSGITKLGILINNQSRDARVAGGGGKMMKKGCLDRSIGSRHKKQKHKMTAKKVSARTFFVSRALQGLASSHASCYVRLMGGYRPGPGQGNAAWFLDKRQRVKEEDEDYEKRDHPEIWAVYKGLPDSETGQTTCYV